MRWPLCRPSFYFNTTGSNGVLQPFHKQPFSKFCGNNIISMPAARRHGIGFFIKLFFSFKRAAASSAVMIIDTQLF